jgi:XTP/dITP diphosphohydrolase
MIKEDRQETLEAFNRLLDIMDELRVKCPWDKKQTWESLRTLTIEETYELADAIVAKDSHGIMEELGDLMLHLVFYSKIGVEKDAFNLKDVLDYINNKLVYRHSHIFSDVKVSSARDVEDNWEKLKLSENGGKKTVLGGVPSSLPALIKAYRIQDKVRGVGFDWDKKEQVWDKVEEEINEFKDELVGTIDEDAMEQEFGDVFFSLVNAARLYGINPENALERTNLKFIKRFNYLEKQTISKGHSLRDMSLDEMDVIWEEAKKADD